MARRNEGAYLKEICDRGATTSAACPAAKPPGVFFRHALTPAARQFSNRRRLVFIIIILIHLSISRQTWIVQYQAFFVSSRVKASDWGDAKYGGHCAIRVWQKTAFAWSLTL
jgi:hypothetical protein